MGCRKARAPAEMRSWFRAIRAQLVACSLGVIGVALFCCILAQAQSTQQQYVYASGGQSVSGFKKDSTTGLLTPTPNSPYNERGNGLALAIDPLGRFLYVLNPPLNNVSVFAIDQTTGVLTEVMGSPFSARDATSPQALAAGPDGSFLYVGNLQGTQAPFTTEGVIDIYAVDASSGTLTLATPSTTPGPFNPTAMVIDAKGRFLFTNAGPNSQTGDPGLASVSYLINPVTGSLSRGAGCPSGIDGRSLAIDPQVRFLFLGYGQLNGFIDSCLISPVDGSGQITGTITLNPSGGQTFADWLAVDSGGRYLYAVVSLGVVRGFTIDQTSGVLTELPPSLLPQVTLGAIVADSQGPYLYAVGPNNTVVGLQIDPSTGALSQITSVAASTPGRVAISSTPVQSVSGPVATFFPATPVNFGSLTVGATSATQLLHLVNTGNQSLGISGISIGGTNSGDFAQSNTCAASLTPNQNCSISLTFTPTTAGTRTAQLLVADNAPGSPQSVPLSGIGVAAQPAVTLVPGSLTFANTLEGSTSPAQSVAITNSGQAPLSISSIIVSGSNPNDFAQTNDCTTTALAPNASCTIHVTFAPVAAGQRTAMISIADNVPGSPQSLPLSGTGVAAQPAVTLVPGSLTFANTLEGSTSPAQSVAITNSGQAPLSISSIILSGSNPNDFAQTNDCTTTALAPNASCTIHVTFAPVAAGQRTAMISIADNAPGSPHTVALSGMGNAPFTVVPSGSNPISATITAGQTAQYFLQLTPAAGFTGVVTVTCSGAPAEAVCQVSQPSIPINNTMAVPFTVSVMTTARGQTLPFSANRRDAPKGEPWMPFVAVLVLLLLTAARSAPAVPRLRLAPCRALGGLALLILAGICGCGGGTALNVQPPPPSGTPAGQYTLTVSATSAAQTSITQTLSLTLTVK